MADHCAISTEDERHQQRLETVIADYIRLCEAGLDVSAQELLSRNPDLAGELQLFLSQRDRMKSLAEPIRGFAIDVFQTVGPGRQISYVGNYELLEEIARGGMGVVYKARQTTLGRSVALKMILAGQLASDEDVRRFHQEARMAASLQHPNIVSIHEVGQSEGWHYFSMDYVEGRNLASLLRDNVLPGRQAARYLRQMAAAIHYAHQEGTLHRDLKPSNILIDGQDQIRITDFGLSGRMGSDSDLTRSGQIFGTPSYMPPEQAQGKRSLIGPTSDVYSLGAILYECVTGRPPFRADTPIQTIQQVIQSEAASPRLLNPAVPRDLETICLKCLEKEPHRRYGTAQLLVDELDRFLRGEPIIARPPAILERSTKWVRRHPAPTGLVLLSLVSILLLVGMGVAQHFNQRLEAANQMLELANSKLETSNRNLQTVNNQLQHSNDRLQEASIKIEGERANAIKERGRAQRFLYASQMALADRARKEGDIGRVMQLLRSVIPESPDEEDLRGFEWNHLWRQYNGEQSRLHGHRGAVTTVAFSPDDRLLATGGADGTIKLWNTVNGKEWLTLTDHGVRVTRLVFNFNGSVLASGGFDGKIILWDMTDGKPLRALTGHKGFVTSLAFSFDGKRLASGSEDKTVRIWDAETGFLLKDFREHQCLVSGVVFGKDGRRIASVSQDGQATTPRGEAFIWDSESGNVLTRFQTPINMSWTCLSISPDGRTIAAGRNSPSRPTKIQMWDFDAASPLREIDAHDHIISSISYSLDGRRLLTSSFDQTLKVWDVQTGQEQFALREETPCTGGAFSPDGLRIASGSDDGTVKLWSPPGQEPHTLHQTARERINNVRFNRNGKLVAAATTTSLMAWDVFRGTVKGDWGTPASHGRLAWNPSTDLIGFGGSILAVDTAKRSDSEDYPIGRNSGMGTSFSRDGKMLAGVINTHQVGIWEVSTGHRLKLLELPSSAMCFATCVAFSPDGRKLALGTGADRYSLPGILEIWDLASLQVERSLTGFRESVLAVTYSPDGSQIAAGFGDARGFSTSSPGEIRIWDTSTSQETHHFRGHRNCVYAIAFSPDGNRLVSGAGLHLRGGGEVKLWDLRTGLEVGSLPVMDRCVYGVDISPCGRRIVTAGGDFTVKVWDGTPLAETPARQ